MIMVIIAKVVTLLRGPIKSTKSELDSQNKNRALNNDGIARRITLESNVVCHQVIPQTRIAQAKHTCNNRYSNQQ